MTFHRTTGARAKPHQESRKPAKVFVFTGRGRARGRWKTRRRRQTRNLTGQGQGHRDAGFGVKGTDTLVELGPFVEIFVHGFLVEFVVDLGSVLTWCLVSV